MPKIGLGTYKLKDNNCVNAVKLALDIGYRHIDTAAVYKNESLISSTIIESGIARSNIFITSKLQPKDQGKEKVLYNINIYDTIYYLFSLY